LVDISEVRVVDAHGDDRDGATRRDD
jgi:hypothetical protein